MHQIVAVPKSRDIDRSLITVRRKRRAMNFQRFMDSRKSLRGLAMTWKEREGTLDERIVITGVSQL
jgi:hypothetical protein